MVKKTGRRPLRGRLLYGLYLFVVVFLLLEIALRIYNPFHLRLKGDKILLPVNVKTSIVNKINPRLDSIIINTRNSLGFRGPEWPADTSGYLTIITVGGSTTECHFLSDDHTWPFLLGQELGERFPKCWLNNAGLDGHSTFGHAILLNDHVKRLRPRVVIFLCGINDVENNAPSFHDKLNTRGAFPDLGHYIYENSEVMNVLLNLGRGWRAQKFNNTTGKEVRLDTGRQLALAASVMEKRLADQQPYLTAYRARLLRLGDTCEAWHILPVFMTQPNLFGEGKDPVTGVDLALFPADPGDPTVNGLLMWRILELYNGVMRGVCAARHWPLVDLAARMPKDSRYYYDMSHFTNQGAAAVASIADSALLPVLDSCFPGKRHL